MSSASSMQCNNNIIWENIEQFVNGKFVQDATDYTIIYDILSMCEGLAYYSRMSMHGFMRKSQYHAIHI